MAVLNGFLFRVPIVFIAEFPKQVKVGVVRLPGLESRSPLVTLDKSLNVS